MSISLYKWAGKQGDVYKPICVGWLTRDVDKLICVGWKTMGGRQTRECRHAYIFGLADKGM